MTRPPFIFALNSYDDFATINTSTTLKEVFLNVDPYAVSQSSNIPGQSVGIDCLHPSKFDNGSYITFFIDKYRHTGTDSIPSHFPNSLQIQEGQHYVFSGKGGDCGYIELYSYGLISIGQIYTELKIKQPVKHMNCKLHIGTILDLYDIDNDDDPDTSVSEPKFIPMQFPFDINIKDECHGFAQHNNGIGDFYTMTSYNFIIYNDNKSVMLSPYEGVKPEIIWHGDPVLFARTTGNPINAESYIYVKDKTMYPYTDIDNILTLNTGITLNRQSDSTNHSVGYPQNDFGHSRIGSFTTKIKSDRESLYVGCVHDIDVGNYNCFDVLTPAPSTPSTPTPTPSTPSTPTPTPSPVTLV